MPTASHPFRPSSFSSARNAAADSASFTPHVWAYSRIAYSHMPARLHSSGAAPRASRGVYVPRGRLGRKGGANGPGPRDPGGHRWCRPGALVPARRERAGPSRPGWPPLVPARRERAGRPCDPCAAIAGTRPRWWRRRRAAQPYGLPSRPPPATLSPAWRTISAALSATCSTVEVTVLGACSTNRFTWGFSVSARNAPAICSYRSRPALAPSTYPAAAPSVKPSLPVTFPMVLDLRWRRGGTGRTRGRGAVAAPRVCARLTLTSRIPARSPPEPPGAGYRCTSWARRRGRRRCPGHPWPMPPPPGSPVAHAAAARGDHGHHRALVQLAAGLRGQLLAVEEVAAGSAGPAPAGARRGVAAPVGEQGEAGRLQDPHSPHDPVAAAVAPGPARAVLQLVALDPHRVLELQRLDRRVERVGHADAHAGRAATGAGA